MSESFATPSNRRALPAILFTVFLDFLGLTLAIPIFTPLCIQEGGILPPGTAMHVRTLVLGWLIGVYPLVQFFSSPILGGLSDRFGRKRVLSFSILGLLAGTLLMAVSVRLSNLPLAFLSRVLMGALSGNLAVNQSAIADISDERSRAKNFGLMGAAFGASFFIGPALGGILSDPKIVPWFYYDIPFWLAGALTLLNFFQVLLFFPETLPADHRRQVALHPLSGLENVIRAFRDPARKHLFWVVFWFGFGFNFFTQFIQVFLIDKFAISTSQIGGLFSYIGLISILVQALVVRPAVDRFRPAQILTVTLLGLALTIPVLMLMPTFTLYFALVALVPLNNGLSFPNLTAVISGLGDRRSQGELLGINQSVAALTQFLPPLIGGFIVGFHYTLPIWISTASILLAWALFVRCRRRQCIV